MKLCTWYEVWLKCLETVFVHEEVFQVRSHDQHQHLYYASFCGHCCTYICSLTMSKSSKISINRLGKAKTSRRGPSLVTELGFMAIRQNSSLHGKRISNLHSTDQACQVDREWFSFIFTGLCTVNSNPLGADCYDESYYDILRRLRGKIQHQ